MDFVAIWMPRIYDLRAWCWLWKHAWHLWVTLDFYFDGPLRVMHCDVCRKGYCYD